jgi:hypothetical protein
MLRRFVVIAVLSCSVLSCQRAATEPDATLTELLAAPTELDFDGVAFQAQVFASRDFAPVAPADGRPLAVVVRVGASFPSVTIERVWVIYSGQVWSSTATRVEGTSDWVAHDGPKWGPGVTVDVVMQTSHPTFGPRLLRRPAVVIGRTD